MASATVNVTERHISDRQTEILRLRAILRKSKAGSPNKAPATARIKVLLTEIAALKASIHYAKPTAQLVADIKTQQGRVQALTHMFKKAPAGRKKVIGKQLRREAKTLNEMLAASKLQQTQHPAAAAHLKLVRVNPVGSEDPLEAAAIQAEDTPGAPGPTEAEALDVEEGSVPAGFHPSAFSLKAAPAYAEKVLTELEDYTNDEGEVWYKNPVVLTGAGVAIWLLLRRR